MKSATWYSRRVVDPLNSVCWFAMDALWLAQLPWPAFAATALALSTGATLIVLEIRSGRRITDDLVLNAWMWMNALWLISDLGEQPSLRLAALGFAVMGGLLLTFDLYRTRTAGTALRRVRKLRISPQRFRNRH